MNAVIRALLLASVGALVLRAGATDEHANYVNAWMRWPLVISGLLLIALAVAVVVLSGSSHEEDDHHHDGVSRLIPWMIVIPVGIGFVVQPPSLGSYVAERRANAADASVFADGDFGSLEGGGIHDMSVVTFIARASTDGGSSLTNAQVRLAGFVSNDSQGNWFVTRMAMGCCAADASAFRVRMEEAPAPVVDEWVEVVGTWVTGSGGEVGETPSLAVSQVDLIDAPSEVYE